MARPKANLAPSTSGAIVPSARRAQTEKKLIGDGAWVTAILIDAEQSKTKSGADSVNLTFEVTNPRLYGGTNLYLTIHPLLDKTLEALNGEHEGNPGFPGVNFLDAEDVWSNCGGQVMRVHVTVDPPRIDEATGDRYDARNRVMSFRARVAKDA